MHITACGSEIQALAKGITTQFSREINTLASI